MYEQLEKPIAAWRQGLADKIGADAKILDELEAHLRDEIDKLIAQGQLPEQAFALAAATIGTPEKLAPEFAKLAAPWWPIRAVAIAVLAIVGLLSVVALRPRDGEADGWLMVHVFGITIGYLLTYGIGMLAACYGCQRMMRELSPGQQTSLVRALVLMGRLALGFTLIGLVTGCVWAHDKLGRYFDIWDVRESGVLIVLIWQAVLLASAARSLRWRMCWGVLGNLAVTYAWFVAAYLSSIHDYDPLRNTFVPWLVFATPVVIAIMATGLLPSGWLRRVLINWLTNAVKRLQQD